MRVLNTAGQDDSEKLIVNQKQIEELNATIEGLSNELTEKTNRIEELCRLANDFRDDTERIKTEVCRRLYISYLPIRLFSTDFYNYFIQLFRLQSNHLALIEAYQQKENELESYRRLLEMHGIWV